MRAVWSTLALSFLISAVGGCQSWSQLGQGLPTGSRVPPPGTGSYQVPGSYYNGQKTGATGGAASGSTLAGTGAMPNGSASAPAPGTVTAAGWQPPTIDQLREGVNNSANAAIGSAASRSSQVVQASTSRAAAALGQFTAPAGPPSTAPAPAALQSSNDVPSFSNEPPRLDWQAPR